MKNIIKLSELPEQVTEDGVKMYGPASYETQVIGDNPLINIEA